MPDGAAPADGVVMTDGPPPPGRPRAPRVRRAVASSLVSGLVYALAAVAVVLLWPSSLGGCTTLTVVRGQSMEPTLHDGDVVLARCGRPDVDDVVVYAPAGYDGTQIIHRVVGGGPSGWVLQGDNNDVVDPFTPADAEVVGIARLTVPHLGAATAFLTHPGPWSALVLLSVLLLAWPGPRRV